MHRRHADAQHLFRAASRVRRGLFAMPRTFDVLSILTLLCLSWTAHAGSLPRCDDGSGVSIYQTLPCPDAQRQVERRDYEAIAATPELPAKHASSSSKGQRRGSQRSGAGRAPRVVPRPAAFECSRRGERWVQLQPCSEFRTRTQRAEAPPRERALDGNELCRRVRDGSLRGSPDERTSVSAYRRNLMRDRRGC
jgi:hypothetical protein